MCSFLYNPNENFIKIITYLDRKEKEDKKFQKRIEEYIKNSSVGIKAIKTELTETSQRSRENEIKIEKLFKIESATE